MTELFFAIISGLANVFVACSMKGAQTVECRTVSFGTVSMILTTVLSFFSFQYCPDNTGIQTYGLLGILMSIVITISIIVNKKGPSSQVWCMANLGLIGVFLRQATMKFAKSCEFKWGIMMGLSTVTAIFILQAAMN